MPNHNFGTVKVGESKHYTIELTNTGSEDLVMEYVMTSCGCTVPENWERGAIAPGETTQIEVTFTGEPDHVEETKNNGGFIERTIDILANTEPIVTEFKLKAKVVE